MFIAQFCFHMPLKFKSMNYYITGLPVKIDKLTSDNSPT